MYFLHFVIVVIGILCCNGQISNLNNFSPLTAGVDEIRAALAAGATCVDIIRLFQNRINRFNSQIQAIVTVNPRLMEIARERDSQKQQGKPLGSLHCVPVLISDNMDVEGLPTTVGSPAMADNIASGSSHGAEEMEHQGAVIVGKANMASFGDCQYQTRSSTGGLTRNPYDITRSPYGPSGGSGAGLAAGFATISLVHGFVIATAGAHGQFGLRVTKGTVPLERVFTLKPNTASSGLIASHVRDLAYTLEVLYGQKNHYSAKLIRNAPVGEIKVGIVGNFLQPINQYGDDMAVLMNYRPDPDMVQMLSGSFSDALRSVGINVKTVTFTPDEMTKLLSTSATFLAETSPESACGLISAKAAVNSYLSETPQTPYNNLAQWLQQRNFTSNGFYADFRSKLQQINSAPDSFTFSPCAKARRASSSLQLLFRNKLETENVNILLYPSSSGEPFRLNSLEFCPQDGYNYAVLGVSLPVYMGWPALAMPMGFSAGGLPYGAVGITEPFYEDLLLALGFAYENSASYQFRIPKDTPVIPGNTLISSKSQQFDQFGGLGQNLYPNVWATPSSVVYPNQYQPSYPLVQTGQTTPNPSAICYGNPFCRYPKKK